MEFETARQQLLSAEVKYTKFKELLFSVFPALNEEAEYWINKLHLRKHPEGGYFVETYRSERVVNLPDYDGSRHSCTAIYYLLEGDQFTSFHTIRSDEVWHFYAGSTLSLHIVRSDGSLIEARLGAAFDKGETFQRAIKSGSWFAASINNPNSYSLVGCTVSPGFDYRDWTLGDVEMLTKMYPQHRSFIKKYTNSFSST